MEVFKPYPIWKSIVTNLFLCFYEYYTTECLCYNIKQNENKLITKKLPGAKKVLVDVEFTLILVYVEYSLEVVSEQSVWWENYTYKAKSQEDTNCKISMAEKLNFDLFCRLFVEIISGFVTSHKCILVAKVVLGLIKTKSSWKTYSRTERRVWSMWYQNLNLY